MQYRRTSCVLDFSAQTIRLRQPRFFPSRDSVGTMWWTMLFFTLRKQWTDSKHFTTFFTNSLDLTERKFTKMVGPILAAAFGIARESCWHNIISTSRLRGRNRYQTSPPSHPTTFTITRYRSALYCIVLYCIVLYYIVLYFIVLYCIVLYCIALYCNLLFSIVLSCIVLFLIEFCCIVLYCFELYVAF